MGIKLNGWDQLDEDVTKLAIALQNEGAGKRIVNAGADIVQAAIVENTPVGPGTLGGRHLKDILRKYPMTRKRGGYSIEVGIKGYDANKAIWVEYGHEGLHKAPAHPFVRPAFDRVKDQAADAMQRQVENELK